MGKIGLKFIIGLGLALAVFAPIGQATASAIRVLYAFQGGSDGEQPMAGLAADGAGNLYGTTVYGGGTGCVGAGCGTVFKLAPDGTETVLYAFQGGVDGQYPLAPLITDKEGNLYGTTLDGGAGSGGTVFELTTDGKKTVLYSFQGGSDGDAPYTGLLRDSAGNLFGTTAYGGGTGCYEGYGCGTVYKLASDGTESVVYAFRGSSDGDVPSGSLVMDNAGNLYGTTYVGGGSGKCQGGCGTVFKVAPDGSETILHSFQSTPDGRYPLSGLIADKRGDLYGTTESGGANGWGAVFEVTTKGKVRVLYSFESGGNANDPKGGLVRDSAGNIYGTTYGGGFADTGTVFKLAADGTETVLARFACHKDGCDPQSTLIMDAAGNLYGTTSSKGGVCRDCGTVFKIKN